MGVIRQRQTNNQPQPKERHMAAGEDVTTTSGSAAGPMTADSGIDVRWGADVSWTTCCCCCWYCSCRLTTGRTGLALDCSSVDASDAVGCWCWWWWGLFISWCYTGIPHKTGSISNIIFFIMRYCPLTDISDFNRKLFSVLFSPGTTQWKCTQKNRK